MARSSMWFTSSVNDPTLVIKDHALQAINKQIKLD
jgi:hypothetical protein